MLKVIDSGKTDYTINPPTQHNEFRIEYTTDSEREHIEVLLRALRIYADRSVRYQDSWQRYGALGAAFFAKDRANRIWDSLRRAVGFEHYNEEDALDIINSAVFCVRSARQKNYGGEFWPKDD